MRRIAILLSIALCLVLAVGAMAAAKDTPVKVYVNGASKNLKPAAFMRGSTVYLPLKATAATVKASVVQDTAKKTFLVTAGNKKTTIKQSQGIMKNGDLMVPMNTIANALNCSLKWDGSAKTVKLTTKRAPCPPPAPNAPAGGG